MQQERENIINIAILLAAGQGKRMKSKVAKQYLEIKGKPVLYYSLNIFQKSLIIDKVVLVVGAGEIDYVRQEVVKKYGFTKVSSIVEGGKERYHSVSCGLQAIFDLKLEEEKQSYCFIHDAARPFVTEEILERAFETVKQEKACVVGMPVKDTIKVANKDGYAETTPNRNLVWTVQTPQVFKTSLIKNAYQQLLLQEEKMQQNGIVITDDACVVEQFTSQKIKLIQGSYHNIKITTPEDLKIAEVFLQ